MHRKMKVRNPGISKSRAGKSEKTQNNSQLLHSAHALAEFAMDRSTPEDRGISLSPISVVDSDGDPARVPLLSPLPSSDGLGGSHVTIDMSGEYTTSLHLNCHGIVAVIILYYNFRRRRKAYQDKSEAERDSDIIFHKLFPAVQSIICRNQNSKPSNMFGHVLF